MSRVRVAWGPCGGRAKLYILRRSSGGRVGKRVKRGWWVRETDRGAGRLRLEKEAMRMSVASMSVFRCLDIGAGGRVLMDRRRCGGGFRR